MFKTLKTEKVKFEKEQGTNTEQFIEIICRIQAKKGENFSE